MKYEHLYRSILKALHHYLVFFMLMASAVTCCTMLFVTVMSHTLVIDLGPEHIQLAAKLTFANVLILTLVISLIDALRRRYTVDLPAKRITDAARRMMQGDFSVRLSPIRSLQYDDRFNEIIACFNQMAEELSGIETLRTDFIANVSHELKTPLSIIQNYGTLLRQPGLDEEKRLEYAKTITAASRNLASLITNILKLNKLENQQLFPEAVPYDLGEQLCECLIGFENAWEQKNIVIETALDDGVTVKSDPELMALVWNNLFSNAIKFTGNGGTVTLKLACDAENAVVSVSDTGCGISREVGARIFDKFYQGDSSHASQGNGLGLALVKRVVDITGCDISVESTLGAGSTFTVRMRRYPDGAPQKDTV